MNRTPKSQDTHLEQAARWLVRSKDKDFSANDRKMLAEWLAQDPANRAAFEEIGGVWDHVGAIEHLFVSENNPLRSHIPPSDGGLKKNKTRKGLFAKLFPGNMKPAAAVAAMVILILLCLPAIKDRFFDQPDSFFTYATARGEQKTVALSDGSFLRINVGTRLSVYITGDRRQVEMGNGEVFFDVTPDPDRPFEVKIPTGQLQVLGTAFNVKSRAGHVAVDVDHGRVRVEGKPASPGKADIRDVVLTAGQGVDILPSGRIKGERRSDIGQVLAWQRQQVVFRNTPVSRVLDELALYHNVKIRLLADGLEAKGITGTFDMGTLDQTLGIIAMAASLKIERGSDGTITLY